MKMSLLLSPIVSTKKKNYDISSVSLISVSKNLFIIGSYWKCFIMQEIDE